MSRLENHEQVMLLLNRRGYSTIITCASCGYTYKCPHCDITLTYHKSSNSLRCHYCGFTKIMSDICPECHEKAIKTYGYGTEQIEKYIRELYPSYRVVRMDTDTTSRIVIQTFNPLNKTLNYVLNNDYLGNYEYEMNIRKILKYPPYYYLVSLKVISSDYNKASMEANKVVNYLKKNLSDDTIILGPTTAAIFKLNNNYRFQILIKYRIDKNLTRVLKEIDEQYIFNKNTYLEIDVDPIRI